METKLDLHGDTWAEAQANFIEFYDQHASAAKASGRFPRLDIVHGYGSTGVGGVLRSRFRGFLERHSPEYLEYQPGESVDGNQGHTFVTPKAPLPTARQGLEREILDYCQTPRTQTKIIGKFRKHGQPEILAALAALARQGVLKSENPRGQKMHRAV